MSQTLIFLRNPVLNQRITLKLLLIPLHEISHPSLKQTSNYVSNLCSCLLFLSFHLFVLFLVLPVLTPNVYSFLYGSLVYQRNVFKDHSYLVSFLELNKIQMLYRTFSSEYILTLSNPEDSDPFHFPMAHCVSATFSNNPKYNNASQIASALTSVLSTQSKCHVSPRLSPSFAAFGPQSIYHLRGLSPTTLSEVALLSLIIYCHSILFISSYHRLPRSCFLAFLSFTTPMRM